MGTATQRDRSVLSVQVRRLSRMAYRISGL
jgi:hypothetical protein